MADTVAILVDDMFFGAKINSAASACGRLIQRIKSRAQLEEMTTSPPSLVIVDLNSDRLEPLAAIEFLKSSPELRSVPIVGYCSHVQTDLIRQAQLVGCDYVLPRSAFSQEVMQIVAGKLPNSGAKE